MFRDAAAVRPIVAILLAGCVGCSDAPPPIAPTVPAPAAVPERWAQYSVGGEVRDTAYRPIADVRIEVVDGQRAGVSVVTDDRGRYELPGTFTGAMIVRASKDGFVAVTRRHDPNTWGQEQQRLSFALEVSSPSVNLTGTYTLTVTADAACRGIPAEARTRIYSASIAPRQNAPERHQYEAVLSGATFIPSPLVGRFAISVAGTFGNFYLGSPLDWGDAIVEELAPSTYLATWGFGGLSVDQSPIAGPLEYGGFEYCVSSTSPVVNGSYRCPTEVLSCGLQRLQLVKR